MPKQEKDRIDTTGKLSDELTLARDNAVKSQADYDAYDARVRADAKAGIEPNADEYFATSEAANNTLEQFQKALGQLPDDGFALESKTSDGRTLMVNASAQKPGFWQLTRFARDGAPWGDTNFRTREQAVKEFLNESSLSTVKDFGGLILDAPDASVAPDNVLATSIQEFRDWFGASKIADASGRPRKVYHGTSKSELDRIIGGWFSEDSKVAREFGAHQYAAYLSIANPAFHDPFFDESDLVREYNEMNGTDRTMSELEVDDGVSLKDAAVSGGPFTRWLESKGYDGLSVYDESNGLSAMAYVPFSPSQIRLTSQVDPAVYAGFKVRKTGPDVNSRELPIGDSKSSVESFYDWFDDSKIVDADNKPLVLFRGLVGHLEISDDALAATPRHNYAVFVTPNAHLAASYANPDEGSSEVGSIVPVYVKAHRLIEFPVTRNKSGWNSFDKFEFDRQARMLGPGSVLVVRQVADTGPRASTLIDPDRLYSYASDIYAFGVGTETRPAIGYFQDQPQFKDVIAHDIPMDFDVASTTPRAMTLMNASGNPVVDSPDKLDAFLRWFQNGVTDELGRPVVAYHGTTGDVSAFDLDYSGSDGVAYHSPAIFSTTDTRLASDYALNKLSRPIANAYRDFQKFKNLNPGVYDDAYEAAFKMVKQAFAENRSSDLPEHGGGANVIPLYVAGDHHPFDGGGKRFMDVMPHAIAEAMALGKDGVIVNNVIDHASPDTDYPSKVIVTFSASNVKSALSNTGTYDRLDPVITNDIPNQPASLFDSVKVGKINALAITAYNGLSGRAKDAVDSWNINWSTGALERAYSQKNDLYDEIQTAFQPVRDAIRRSYGDRLTLYRGERNYTNERKNQRELFSWTLDEKLARQFAANGRTEVGKITDAEIDVAAATYERTGFVSFHGKKYLRNKKSPEFYTIFDSGNSVITDGDDIVESLRDTQQFLAEMSEDTRTAGVVYTREIDVEDIRWIPVGANLAQQEFIVTHDPVRDLRFDIESLMEDSSIARLESGVQARILGRLQRMKLQINSGDEHVMPSAESIIADATALATPSNRGADAVRGALQSARGSGLLKPAVVDFALWALDQSPDLAKDLSVSISPTSASGTAGNFSSANRMMTLFADRANESSAVHEMLHNVERYLPTEVQDGILTEWLRAYMTAWSKAGIETRQALDDMLLMDSDDKATERVLHAFRTGKLQYRDHYQLTNPSEFWAVNATEILANRHAAKGGWIATAKRWLAKFVAKVKDWLKIDSESAVVKGLNAVLDGTAKSQASAMLMQRTGSFNDISDMKQEIEALQESLRKAEMATLGLNYKSPLRQPLIDECAGYRKRLWELTGDAYGKPKTKRPKAPDDDLLNADYASPDEIPKEVLSWVSRSSIINSDATDAVRWSRIIDTLEDDRYPEGEDVTLYRAVDSQYDTIREGDWVTTDLSYAEEHNERWLKGKGHIIEITVDGADVLTSPSGNHEEAIYAPREFSGPVSTLANDVSMSPLTDIAGFDGWFNGSAAVTEDGEPLVLYHGTRGDVEKFDPNRFGSVDHGTVGHGIYATADRGLASNYARSTVAGVGMLDGGNVMPLYLSIKNPIGFDDAIRVKQAIIAQKRIEGVSDEDLDKEIGALLTSTLRAMGHDGVSPTLGEWPGVGNSWTAFDPSQVKSAIGNNGNYSITDSALTHDISSIPQVETEQFKKWFRSSGIVNDDGSPKIVFHATDVKFDTFTRPELGFHFAERENLAHNAARKGGKFRTEALQVYLSIENPIEITGQSNGFTLFRLLDDLYARQLLDDDKYNQFMDEYEQIEENDDGLDDDEVRNALNDLTIKVAEQIGADGFKYWNEFDAGEGVEADWSYIALRASQIKSATNNNGAFSLHKNSIVHDIPMDAESVQPASERVAEAERLIREMDEEDSLLIFHSGDASVDDELKSFVEPQFGPWLKEVLAGATDCDELANEIQEADPVAFFSLQPTWIAMKAARAVGKHVGEVTIDDIRSHGQLCLIFADRSRRTSLYVADKEGKAVNYFDISDKLYNLPFGVEPGDLFSFDGFAPEITLTGDALVEFLLRNYPGKELSRAFAAGEIDRCGRSTQEADAQLITAYHGTNAQFEQFDTESVNEVDRKRLGAHFSSNERYASTYGDTLVEVHLALSSPFDITGMDAAEAIKALPVSDRLKQELRSAFRGPDYSQYGLLETAQREQLRESLQAAGYDGVKYVEGCGDAYIVFDSKDIKIQKVTNLGDVKLKLTAAEMAKEVIESIELAPQEKKGKRP